ncbi:hypothetical protein J4E83_001138 [Alternaria metachromatica]|uniref:uncharacterized protein n=1 Tax=Alternaria metachromatica TaxID=283354 RepID=UPI0020C3F011|nr:uncharacterized protein J4E83_001138 [Alternaria metachromatica]KAI4636184.1 hypothetical protein J4E83_001138 [Alternaria metachromatica]
MLPLTQDEVFRQIKQKAKRKQHEKTAFTSGVVTKLLKDLYNPDLQRSLFFYSQDESGIPRRKVATHAAGRKHYCTVALQTAFNAEHWHDQTKPAAFRGNWPPSTIEGLIGDVDETESCIEPCPNCEAPEDVAHCMCGYNAWVKYLHGFWLSHLLLQDVGSRGHGVFARKVIHDSTIVGEYAGQIIPFKDDGTPAHGQDAYRVGISIGKPNFDQTQTHATASIDALHTGGVTRFINHSCNPNTEFVEMVCSMERRAVYVVTKRKVPIGEELTLDYGPKWFKDDQYCLCDTADCRNPRKISENADASEVKVSGDETADEGGDEDDPGDTSTASDDSASSSEASDICAHSPAF